MPPRRWPDELATDELRLQQEFLQFLRQTAVEKVAGLSRALAAAAPLATSPRTTALGLIKHLTAVERHWISITAAGADLPSLWPGSPDPSWDLSDADTPDTVIAAYRAEWSRSADALSGRRPGDLAADGGRTVRWILAHVNQETARHVGHLDVLRELADGAVGE
ncbi:mycothiol transferase [Pseudonocardia sichuanensis]